MIKNRWRAAIVLAMTIGGGGCGTSDPATNSLQGVVEYEERDLSFEVTGRIAEVAVHEGDTLPASALVARIVPDIERSALTARESEARAVEAQLGLLRAGARPEDIRALAARADAARASESLLRSNAERSRKLFAASALSRAAARSMRCLAMTPCSVAARSSRAFSDQPCAKPTASAIATRLRCTPVMRVSPCIGRSRNARVLGARATTV